MLIEVMTGNDEDKKNYMKELVRVFIETKKKIYGESERNGSTRDSENAIFEKQYLASLWMIFSVIGIMQPEDIAEQLGVSYSLLQKWEGDNTFKALVQENYKEFLNYIVDLFA
jgi:hypothetical protein